NEENEGGASVFVCFVSFCRIAAVHFTDGGGFLLVCFAPSRRRSRFGGAGAWFAVTLRAQRANPKSRRDDTRVAPDKRSAVRGNDVMSILLFPRFAATARGLSRRAAERGSCWWWWCGYPRRQSLRSFALG